MAFGFDKYTFESLDTIVGFRPSDDACLFILDEIQDGEISGDAELTWSTGRRGRRLAATKSNKTCSITANNGFVVGGLLAVQIGDENPTEDFETASIKAPAFEKITVGDTNTVTLSHQAIGENGNEIGLIYKANKDGSQGESYAQAAAASATEFAFDGADTITLPANAFKADDVVIVFYNYNTKGRMYTNKSSNYAGSAKIICDITVKDVCDGTTKHSKVIFPRVEISDTWSFSFGNDNAVHAFSAEAAATMCDSNGDSDYFYWINI